MHEKFILPTESTPGDTHAADYDGRVIDVYKLIVRAETQEAIATPMSELAYLKDNHFWHDSRGHWLGPRDVIDAVQRSVDHNALLADDSLDTELRENIRKVLNADYEAHPILMIKDRVVDGAHRLTKAFLDNAATIHVRRFEELPEGVLLDHAQ